MCGIFGYVGSKNASAVILEGLKRLEYRGYDSWGIAVVDEEIKVSKQVGAIGDLVRVINLPQSSIGIGHTRWATHGGITQDNAHPHFSSDKSFVLAQNGIVENYLELKKDLLKDGFKFKTETDTEVIVKLIESYLKRKNDLQEAVRKAFLSLAGRNTIIVLSKDNQIIGARNGSPLVVGVSSSNEIFFSSDTLSFAPFVEKIMVVDDGQMAVYKQEKIELWDCKLNKKINYQLDDLNLKSSKVDKEGYDHFMLKEIFETPYIINQIINQDFSELEKLAEVIKKSNNVYTLGSGTAGVASAQMAFFLRTFANINAISLSGAEAYEYYDLLKKDDLIITLSQSGETADVLEVLESFRKKGLKIASLVNMLSSSLTRLSDFKFYNLAGPEICVMSTKVFSSQIAWGYLVSKIVAGEGRQALKNLKDLSIEIERYLNLERNHLAIKQVADFLSSKKDIFLLGKYQNLNIIKEGMIKIIEGSYIHAHGLPAGDLKHYAITLIEKGLPVIVVLSEDLAKSSVLNAVNEVKARGAAVVGLASKNYEKFDFFLEIPDTGETNNIMNIIPLQLLAYYLSVKLGNNVDKPRNIAKSVTVK